VKVSSSVSPLPTPRLIVNVKGAVPGTTNTELTLDGVLADSVVMKSEDDRNTTVVVELPLTPDKDDYKVFTLPRDVANKKPFRVVIDVSQPLPLGNFTFTPGLKDKLIVLDPGHGGATRRRSARRGRWRSPSISPSPYGLRTYSPRPVPRSR
jgi:N-acetylmuramoyl-L-alanine amidase